MMSAPDVEVRDAKVVAYFPAGIDAAYLSPTEAREWALALDRAAAAADLMSPPTRGGARLLRVNAAST